MWSQILEKVLKALAQMHPDASGLQIHANALPSQEATGNAGCVLTWPKGWNEDEGALPTDASSKEILEKGDAFGRTRVSENVRGYREILEKGASARSQNVQVRRVAQIGRVN